MIVFCCVVPCVDIAVCRYWCVSEPELRATLARRIVSWLGCRYQLSAYLASTASRTPCLPHQISRSEISRIEQRVRTTELTGVLITLDRQDRSIATLRPAITSKYTEVYVRVQWLFITLRSWRCFFQFLHYSAPRPSSLFSCAQLSWCIMSSSTSPGHNDPDACIIIISTE